MVISLTEVSQRQNGNRRASRWRCLGGNFFSWEKGNLFGLYLIQTACSLYELSVCCQQFVVFGMIVAQNHARIYNVVVEVDFLFMRSADSLIVCLILFHVVPLRPSTLPSDSGWPLVPPWILGRNNSWTSFLPSSYRFYRFYGCKDTIFFENRSIMMKKKMWSESILAVIYAEAVLKNRGAYKT